MRNIVDIVQDNNACADLLCAYEKEYGRKVDVRIKPWWFPFKKAVTTTPGVIWWAPGRTYRRPKHALGTLAHELQHDLDMSDHPALWLFLYFSPQIWAAFGLLGFLGFVFPPLWALFALLLLAVPWPSPWRVSAEVRGYAVSMYVMELVWGTKAQPPAYAKVLSKFVPYWIASWSIDATTCKLEKCYEDRTELMDLVDEVL